MPGSRVNSSTPKSNEGAGAPADGAGREQVTIALVADHSWCTDDIAIQLLRWRYSILWVRPFDLPVSEPLMKRAALILTNRTRWQIEETVESARRLPVVTTDNFDLHLQRRIEAYLRSRGVAPPA
jgi:hypothetical protein